MSTVYQAYDTRLERDVAIKIIRREVFSPLVLERVLKRFEREAKALAKLSHPNIVHVHDYGEYESAPYLVMEYLPGGTLKQNLGKPMHWKEAVKLLLPISEALDYAHSQNIIHRDIKPSNILLTQRGQPMLSDFGIAKILESEETATLTGTGVGVGTPEYMAPEQWIGQAGTQADLYSLGVVLYELVTGRKPYTADTPAAILLKQANDPLPRPRQFAPALPETVEKVLFKALAKKPDERYAGMAGMTAALDALLAGESRAGTPGVPAPPASLMAGPVIDAQAQDKQTGDLPEATHAEMPPARMVRDSIPSYDKMPPIPPGLTPADLSWWQHWGAWLGIGGSVLAVLAVITLLWLWMSGDLSHNQPYVSPMPTAAPNPTLTPVPALTPRPGSTWTRPADGMVMVYVWKGEFSMGNNNGESDEQPVHTVSLDAYWIDKVEVTNAMYARCVSDGGCQSPIYSRSIKHENYFNDLQYDNYPVIYVNWNNARDYCTWAGVRLPTEAEWEKAARGTDGRIYPWGNDRPGSSLLNYNGNIGDTTAVGSYPSGASPSGALDMAGNVWEWVNDWYDVYPAGNKNASIDFGTKNRVLRGGAWGFDDYHVRTSDRFGIDPTRSSSNIGFRCSRSFP